MIHLVVLVLTDVQSVATDSVIFSRFDGRYCLLEIYLAADTDPSANYPEGCIALTSDVFVLTCKRFSMHGSHQEYVSGLSPLLCNVCRLFPELRAAY